MKYLGYILGVLAAIAIGIFVLIKLIGFLIYILPGFLATIAIVVAVGIVYFIVKAIVDAFRSQNN